MLLALLHAGSAELQARRAPEADAVVVATVIGAVTSASETDAEFIAQRIGAFARSHVTASGSPSPLFSGPRAFGLQSA